MLNLPVDQLRPHPRQREFFKPLEGKPREDFDADINARGIAQPVIVSDRTGEWVIADGHQRVSAAKRLGILEVPCVVTTFASEPDEVRCLVMNNVQRRQLSREEIDAVIGYWLKQFTKHSNKRIGDEIGVSDHTVEVKRQEMESASQIAKVDKVEGKDGKLYPRAKPKRTATEPVKEPEDTTTPDAELYGVPVWFDREPILAEQPVPPPGWQPTETYKALERAAKLILNINVSDAREVLGSEPNSPASLRLQLLTAKEQLLEILEVERDEKVITVGKPFN